jgi:hypothetical protein
LLARLLAAFVIGLASGCPSRNNLFATNFQVTDNTAGRSPDIPHRGDHFAAKQTERAATVHQSSPQSLAF